MKPIGGRFLLILRRNDKVAWMSGGAEMLKQVQHDDQAGVRLNLNTSP